MKKFITILLRKILNKVENTHPLALEVDSHQVKRSTNLQNKQPEKKKKDKPKHVTGIIPYKENPTRDLIEMMEVPFLALSKKRKSPIIYESPDKRIKVSVTRHTGHFLASIYDWDIILFLASKMQDIINSASDIPPRTMVVPRYEILKSLHKYDGSKQLKDLESSLERLQLTGMDTTIRNEDYRYRAGFGFLDSWGYTERKDIKEIRITLSQWLYDGICAKGALLKVDTAYFDLTSALKKFLYRTARKHVGNNTETWEFSIEKLYEKSGSERELKKFKSDLKVAVTANDIPEYTMQWLQKRKRCFVLFKRLSNTEKINKILEEIESTSNENQENTSQVSGQNVTDVDNNVHKIL